MPLKNKGGAGIWEDNAGSLQSGGISVLPAPGQSNGFIFFLLYSGLSLNGDPDYAIILSVHLLFTAG